MAETPLPQNIEAEEAVLGSVLVDPDALFRIRELLKPESFQREKHGWVYSAMCDLSDEGIPPDYMTVCDLLERRGKLKQAGGQSWVTSLITAAPTSVYAEHYAKMVKSYAVRRNVIGFGTRVVQAAYKEEDVDKLIGYINSQVMELEAGAVQSGPRNVSEAVSELYDDLEEWMNDPLPPDAVRGISTGIKDWDGMMNGMVRGESLVILAAASGTGKTALAITSAFRMAKMGYRVLVFALEMKARTLVARLAAADSGVSFKKVRRGVKEGSNWYASGDEFGKFTSSTLDISTKATNLYIDETQDLTMSEIRARSMILAHKLGGIDLVVVDTGNLVQSPPDRAKTFAQTESDKVRSFRNLIKELDCVGYMTWQLVKGVDSRPVANFGRAPTLGDMRDTGGVREHASDVIGLYRDALYNPDSMYKNTMRLLALKRRDDQGNTFVDLGFDPVHQRFYPAELRRQELEF